MLTLNKAEFDSETNLEYLVFSCVIDDLPGLDLSDMPNVTFSIMYRHAYIKSCLNRIKDQLHYRKYVPLYEIFNKILYIDIPENLYRAVKQYVGDSKSSFSISFDEVDETFIFTCGRFKDVDVWNGSKNLEVN